MIAKLRARLGRRDAGVSLVEVLIALMVFSVVAVGMALSLYTTQRLSTDNSSRAVAANIAASTTDSILAWGNPFTLDDGVDTKTVNGVTYSITRSAQWKSDKDDGTTTTSCGVTGGNLLYRSYNVQVTWAGQMILKNPVSSDVILAPSSRINDSTNGTIVISTFGADGFGRAGVTVTVTPKSGGTGQALVTQPVPTDDKGCAYALHVVPGEYSVKVSKDDYLDTVQNPTPTTGATFNGATTSYTTVSAGSTQVVSVEYDKPVTLKPKYRPNAGGAILPDNNQTSYYANGSSWTYSGAPSQVPLHPFGSAYTASAGKYTSSSDADPVGCTSVDPAAWDEGPSPSGNRGSGVASTANSAAAGTNADIDIPMGVVTVTMPNIAGVTGVQAVAKKNSGYPGDPGCTTGITYTFSGLKRGNTYQLALPYGSWTMSTTGVTSVLGPGQMTLVGAGQISPSNVVTFDPRPAA
ncbi:MAG: prepilin-type N-terminal cleavage/methylation domain-containing protein [Gordonia polyisoprenivorans]|nr:prepilin-type N-terminal cleavage/methylation domain-containing protein [Gordonia polyisoprenivorans]